MSYTPSSGATSIAGAIATSLNSAGFPAMQTAISGGAQGPLAMVDGWLRQATEPVIYGSYNWPNATITGNGTFQVLGSWNLSSYCPRPQRLIFNTTAFITGTIAAFTMRLKYNGVVVSSCNYLINAVSSHTTLPTLVALVTPPAALVAYSISFEVSVPTGTSLIVDGNDVYSIQLG